MPSRFFVHARFKFGGVDEVLWATARVLVFQQLSKANDGQGMAIYYVGLAGVPRFVELNAFGL